MLISFCFFYFAADAAKKTSFCGSSRKKQETRFCGASRKNKITSFLRHQPQKQNNLVFAATAAKTHYFCRQRNCCWKKSN
jgi:hypothetical protein